jgi:hypothetical protein
MLTDLKEMRKVLMPMIRKVMPALIANEIIGVQPMAAPKEGWELHEDKYNAYPYEAAFVVGMWAIHGSATKITKMKQWCEEALTPGNWYLSTNTFYFRNAGDRTMFMLKIEP